MSAEAVFGWDPAGALVRSLTLVTIGRNTVDLDVLVHPLRPAE